MFLYIKRNESGFPWIFLEPKNCYRWFPMISGYGTKNLLSMGFEILGLDLWSLIIMPWRRFGAHARDLFRIAAACGRFGFSRGVCRCTGYISQVRIQLWAFLSHSVCIVARSQWVLCFCTWSVCLFAGGQLLGLSYWCHIGFQARTLGRNSKLLGW